MLISLIHIVVEITWFYFLNTDPHIKIAGLPENIKKAKDMVAVKLESKVLNSMKFYETHCMIEARILGICCIEIVLCSR